jgi:hypothetical protein
MKPSPWPVRPANVPESAIWEPMNATFGLPLWSDCGLDPEGRRHGLSRKWMADGLLRNECRYIHGEVHGINTEYHPDGTIASTTDWVHGVCLDATFYRSEKPTTLHFPADAAPNVWSARFFTRNGRTNYTQRYYTREGVEVSSAGEPLPTRPASVSPDARWITRQSSWVLGEIDRQGSRQVGSWRWWTREGLLRREEERSRLGDVEQIMEYQGNGVKQSRQRFAQHDGRWVRIEDEKFHPNGRPLLTRRRDLRGRDVYEASFTDDGTVREEVTTSWDDNGVVSRRERGRGGRLLLEARREGPSLACILYNVRQEPYVLGELDGDRLCGRWRIFDEQGALLHELEPTAFAISSRLSSSHLLHALGEALLVHLHQQAPLPAELAGADDVDWTRLESCHSPQLARFPLFLRGLVSTEPLVRTVAMGFILRETLHQGTVYQVTARVTPFLVRALAHPDCNQRSVLSVLLAFGESAWPHAAEATDLVDHDPRREAILGTLDALTAGWPAIWRLMDQADGELRRQILLLARFPQEPPRIRSDLAEFARRDGDPALRACAIEALSDLRGVTIDELAPSLEDPDPLVRAAAAVAAGRTFGPACPMRVVDVLSRTLSSWESLADRFAELPYADGHLLAYLAAALGAIGTAPARALTSELCRDLDGVDPQSALSYGHGLLTLALGRGDRPFAEAFLEVLGSLAKSRQFNEFNVNAAEVLERWNLPADAAGLRALVAELRAVADPEALLHARMHRDADENEAVDLEATTERLQMSARD